MMQVGLPDISRLLAMLRWAGLTLRQRKQRLYTRLANDPSRTVLQMTCQACSSTLLILQKNNEYSDCFGLSRHKGLLP